MTRDSERENASTLLELLVVSAIIGILAALLLPALNKASASAKRASCLNNLRQINLAVRQYADDHNSLLPMITNSGPAEGLVGLRALCEELPRPEGKSLVKRRGLRLPSRHI